MRQRRVPTVQTVQPTAEILQVLVEVPQTQFIVRCEQRRVLTGSSSSWTRLLAGPVVQRQVLEGVQYIDNVVGGVPVVYVARGGFWNNFPHFLRGARAVHIGTWTSFPRAPCVWQLAAPVRCDSQRKLVAEFQAFFFST